MSTDVRPSVEHAATVLGATVAPPVRERRPRTGPRGSFRRDIQGLRAIAVLVVVLSHVGLSGFDGGYVGVDVFLVVSGFLITDHLLRELASTGTIRFGAFYAWRIRRLLPASAAVVVVSGVVTVLFESVLAARHLAEDALWAAVYGMNVQLAIEGTDYFASEQTPSTLQHFWSLAVEEQFYVVWPLVLLAAGVWTTRRRADGHRAVRFSRRGVLLAVSAVVAVSLALSVWQTGTSRPWAYFGLHTRAWELGAGALLAVALPYLVRLPAAAGRVLSWVGLAAIAVAVLAFDEHTAFPGWTALLPVTGAVLVLVGGSVALEGGAQRLLGRGPFQLIGAVSYSWYLWHWPFLLLMPAILGWEGTTLENLFAVGVALLISIICYTNIETPVRAARSLGSPRRGLGLGITLTMVTAALAGLALVALPPAVGHGSPVSVAAGDVSTVAASVELQAVPSNLTPTVDVAPDDVAESRGDRCHLNLRETQVRRPCDYGDAGGKSTMVLFGDSHADQWLPALDTVAADNGYRLLTRTKAPCPPVDMVVRAGDLGREYTECTRWRADVMDEIADVEPDVVVLSASYGVSDKSPGDWGRGTTSTVSRLTQLGITVVYIDDTPRRAGDDPAPDCVAANLSDVSACTTAQEEAFPSTRVSAAVLQAVRRSGGLTIDPINWFCASGQCPAVIGNYLVYRDQSHITASYMRFLEPRLARALGL